MLNPKGGPVSPSWGRGKATAQASTLEIVTITFIPYRTPCVTRLKWNQNKVSIETFACSGPAARH